MAVLVICLDVALAHVHLLCVVGGKHEPEVRQSLGGSRYCQGMAEGRPVGTITPRELAEELGVSDRTIRQWLRKQGWQSMPYARWHLTPEQARRVREHFLRA